VQYSERDHNNHIKKRSTSLRWTHLTARLYVGVEAVEKLQKPASF